MSTTLAVVDTSVLVTLILKDSLLQKEQMAPYELYASELAVVELSRSIHRDALCGKLPETCLSDKMEECRAVLDALILVPVHREVIRLASGAFATPVRSLDALHIATALWLKERSHQTMAFITRDKAQAKAASLSGLRLVLLE